MSFLPLSWSCFSTSISTGRPWVSQPGDAGDRPALHGAEPADQVLDGPGKDVMDARASRSPSAAPRRRRRAPHPARPPGSGGRDPPPSRYRAAGAQAGRRPVRASGANAISGGRPERSRLLLEHELGLGLRVRLRVGLQPLDLAELPLEQGAEVGQEGGELPLAGVGPLAERAAPPPAPRSTGGGHRSWPRGGSSPRPCAPGPRCRPGAAGPR